MVLASVVRLVCSNAASIWAETRHLLEILVLESSPLRFAAAQFAAVLHWEHLQGSLHGSLVIFIMFEICRTNIRFKVFWAFLLQGQWVH